MGSSPRRVPGRALLPNRRDPPVRRQCRLYRAATAHPVQKPCLRARRPQLHRGKKLAANSRPVSSSQQHRPNHFSQQGAASIQQLDTGYRLLTDFLGIPRKDSKDVYGIITTVLGVEVNTVKMETRLPSGKGHQSPQAYTRVLKKDTMNRHEAE